MLREEYKVEMRVLGVASSTRMLLSSEPLDLATWKEDFEARVSVLGWGGVGWGGGTRGRRGGTLRAHGPESAEPAAPPAGEPRLWTGATVKGGEPRLWTGATPGTGRGRMHRALEWAPTFSYALVRARTQRPGALGAPRPDGAAPDCMHPL